MNLGGGVWDANIQMTAITVSPVSLGVKAAWLNAKSTSFDVRQPPAEPQLTSYGFASISTDLFSFCYHFFLILGMSCIF